MDVSCGWNYVVDDTGYKVHGTSLASLILNVKEHMSANEIEIPKDLAQLIEADICKRVNPSFCKEDKS